MGANETQRPAIITVHLAATRRILPLDRPEALR
jgi:hypothetical protein